MYVIVTQSYHVATERIHDLLGYEHALFNGEQEKEFIICVTIELKELSIAITVCDLSASLMMQNRDPQDEFFYPTLILMMDS